MNKPNGRGPANLQRCGSRAAPGRRESVSQQVPDLKPTVSIIVPTHNYRELLRGCLLSLLGQEYPANKHQIIIVDDASTDGTDEMVAQMQRFSPQRVLYVRSKVNKGPGATRNLGLRLAAGEVIAFIDADMTAAPDWVEKAVPWFTDPKVGGCEGRVVLGHPEKVTPFSHWSENLRGKYFGAGNNFYRRSVLEAVGGFDEGFYDARRKVHFREDIELAFRVMDRGWEIPFAPDVVAYHPPLPGSWKRPIKLAQRYYFDPLLRKKHPAMFKEYVERHQVGPFSIRRPKSYLYMANIFSVALGAVSLAPGAWTPAPGPSVWIAGFSALLYLATLGLCVLLACRHSWRNVPILDYFRALAVYSLVPWVYLESTLRGRWASRGPRAVNARLGASRVEVEGVSALEEGRVL